MRLATLGLLGLVLAVAGLAGIRSMYTSDWNRGAAERLTEIDPTVVLVTLVLALLAGAVAGLFCACTEITGQGPLGAVGVLPFLVTGPPAQRAAEPLDLVCECHACRATPAARRPSASASSRLSTDCTTSNSAAAVRHWRCSARMPAGYCTGIA